MDCKAHLLLYSERGHLIDEDVVLCGDGDQSVGLWHGQKVHQTARV